MKLEMTSALSAASCLSFLVLLMIGIFPQSAAEPLMMVPFAGLSIYLIAANKLTKIEGNNGTILILLLLWGTWATSSITTAIPFPSKVTLIILGTLPVSFLAARTLTKNPLPWLGGIALPFAAYTLWESINGVFRPQSPFEDPNLLGLFFTMAALTTIPQFEKDTKAHIKALSFLLALTLTAALVVTQSRSAFLCLFVGGLSYMLLSLRTIPKPSNTTWIAIAAFGTATLSAVFLTGFTDRFLIIKDGVLDSNIAGRMAIWSAAWDMAWQHPITGFGLGTFHLYYPQFRTTGDNSQGWMAHMDPLQSATESGWPSAILLYLLFGYTAYLVIRNRTVITPVQKTAAALLSAFFIAMHLNYPLHSVPFLMIIGAALATLSFPTTNKRILPAVSWGVLVTLLSALWLMLQSSITLMLINESRLAANLHNQARFGKAISSCLHDGDKDFPDCRVMAAKFMILAQNTDRSRILSLLDEADKANPVSPEIPYQRALLESRQHDKNTDLILAYLQLSLTRNPSYWPARRMAIGVYAERGDMGKAISLLQDGMLYRYAAPTRNDIRRISKELGMELK